MALLLAMFQKMRIQRELNEYTLRDAKISSKKSRIQKNIERTQKRYTSLIAQIDAQAKMMASQAKVQLNQMIGMDMMNSNPYSGLSIFVTNMMGGMLANDVEKRNNKGELTGETVTMNNTLYQEMMTEYMNGTLKAYYEEGKNTQHKDTFDTREQLAYGSKGQFSEEQMQLFNQAMRSAQMQQQQAQMWAQQQSANFEQNSSIWAEARKAELEAEQDAMLEPLNYEDTMLDLEKASVEARLEQLRAEKESYDRLCSEEAKNSAPTFGLG